MRFLNPSFLLSCAVLAGAGFSAASAAAEAQYPSQPITWVVGTSAGGASDVITRMVAKEMSALAGVPIIVDNRPGGATSIAASLVSRAAPDGYTLLTADNGTLVFNIGLFPQLNYNPDKDFKMVGLMVDTPLFIAVAGSSPIKTIQDLLEIAKAEPGKLDYATPGIGSPHHLAMEMFKDSNAVDIVHVPYIGMAKATPAVLGGHVALMVADAASGMPQFKEGALRPLASFSDERHPMLPDVPTLKELNLSDTTIPAWIGAVVPADTPPAIIETLSGHLQAALQKDSVKDRLTNLGLRVPAGTSEEMQRYRDADKDYWISLIHKQGIQAQ